LLHRVMVSAILLTSSFHSSSSRRAQATMSSLCLLRIFSKVCHLMFLLWSSLLNSLHRYDASSLSIQIAILSHSVTLLRNFILFFRSRGSSGTGSCVSRHLAKPLALQTCTQSWICGSMLPFRTRVLPRPLLWA